MTLWGRVAILTAAIVLKGAEPLLEPISVCEAMGGLGGNIGKNGRNVALVGRYSYRSKGKWLDQEGCGAAGERMVVMLALDRVAAPKPPEPVAIDEEALDQRLATMKRKTALGKFKFGSADYDRWAVVFGRLEGLPGGQAQLVYRGDGAVFFFVEK